MITAALLQRLGHRGMTPATAATWAAAFTPALARFQIDTPLRQAHFLAQVLHETGGLRWLEELWGPSYAQSGYEGRRDLGNTQPGDGHRFRGRGPFQLTGRANYRVAGTELGYPLESQPDLVLRPDIGALTAARYWNGRRLNPVADLGDGDAVVERISAAVNGRNRATGKPNHLPERIAAFREAWAALRDPPGVILIDPGGGEVRWDGVPTTYAGTRLDDALVASLRVVYPAAGGPWVYGTVFRVWVRRTGDLVLERLRPAS